MAKNAGLNLLITAKDAKGDQFFSECVDGDLYLWNFGAWIAYFLHRQFNTSDPTAYQMTDTTGTARTVGTGIFMASYYYNSGYTTNVGYWRNTLKAVVGSGSTGAAITDYAPGQEVTDALPTAPKLITDGNTLKIVFSATFPMAEETVCAEVGLRMKGAETGGSSPLYLMTRDTFTPVTVPAAGSLTVQFELWFNATPA